MHKLINNMKKEKGFTLIELMIVIAIIGILAAIAVPQFVAYRMRAFNASGKAVVHNLKADQSNLYSETSRYGVIDGTARTLIDSAGLGTAASVSTSVTAGLNIPSTSTVVGARLTNTRLAVSIVLGNDMGAECSVDTTGASFLAFARHERGDTAYGIDSDVESLIYSVSRATWADATATGVQATTPAAVASADDIKGQSGGGSPVTNWEPMN